MSSELCYIESRHKGDQLSNKRFNEYFALGARLARQIASPNAYFDANRGVTDVRQAMSDFHFLDKFAIPAYKVEKLNLQSLDVSQGPDFVVISRKPGSEGYRAELAYVYDYLDMNEDLNNHNSPQATVLIDDIASSVGDTSALRKTIKLVTMKLNFESFGNGNNPEIILGVHDKLLRDRPKFSNIFDDFGFLKDRRSVSNNGLVLFHLGTKFRKGPSTI